jgi:hypothetical protein
MADDKIALSIEIEADRAQMSLGELEEGFDGLREKLKATNRGTEEGRAAFKELSTQMAQTGAEIKNIELGFESLDQDQIASEFGGLAGGIGDVTASLVLMGGENETIEQMGKSIETAMAISMGFKGAIEGASAGMKLYNNMIKTGKLQVILYSAAAKAAAIATKALNLIMKANPIGLVVAGITAAVVAYKSFSKESKEASFAQTAFTDASNKAQIATVTQKIELNKLIKVAKDDTLSKRQRQAAIEDLNKLAPDYLGNITLETINTKEATAAIGAYVEGLERKARAAALQNELVRIETELIENNRIIREGSDEQYLEVLLAKESEIPRLKEQKKAILDLMNAENNETDAYVGNSAKKAEADKAAAEAKKSWFKIWETTEKAISDKGKETIKKTREQREKDREEARKQLIEDAKTLADFEEEQARIKIQLIQDEGERARAEIEYNSQLELEALEKKGTLTFDAEMLIAQKKNQALADLEKAEDDKRFAAEKEAQAKKDEYNKLLFDAKVANEKEETERQKLQLEEDYKNNIATLEEQGLLTMELEFELMYAKEQALADIQKEFREKAAAEKQAQRDKDFALASAAIGALSALNKAATDTALLNAAGDEEKKEKIRKASFEREKKLNVAMALINGAQAVLAGFAQGGLPMAIVAGVTAAAQLAAILATTYQGGGSVKQVDNTAPVEPDGAGAGGAGAQINPVTNTSTILGNQQVYVTETDITSTQNNVSVIEESATF